MIRPTSEQALDFALMLNAGMPPEDAIVYFAEEGQAAEEMAEVLPLWLKSKEVASAILTLQGKKWQDMTAEEKIQFAINKHYTEMAYFLYSHNYSTLTGAYKSKADTCRAALEAKLAGTAGKMTALDRFLTDAASGKVKIPSLQVQ